MRNAAPRNFDAENRKIRIVTVFILLGFFVVLMFGGIFLESMQLSLAFVAFVTSAVMFTGELRKVRYIEAEDPSANPRADWANIAIPLVATVMTAASFFLALIPVIWPYVMLWHLKATGQI